MKILYKMNFQLIKISTEKQYLFVYKINYNSFNKFIILIIINNYNNKISTIYSNNNIKSNNMNKDIEFFQKNKIRYENKIFKLIMINLF